MRLYRGEVIDGMRVTVGKVGVHGRDFGCPWKAADAETVELDLLDSGNNGPTSRRT